jgi:hypothetical protein
MQLYCHIGHERQQILIVHGPTNIVCHSPDAQIAWFECDEYDRAMTLNQTELTLDRPVQVGQTTRISLFRLTEDAKLFEDQSDATGLVVKGRIRVQKRNSFPEECCQGKPFPLNSLGTELWIHRVEEEPPWIFLVEHPENPLAEILL